MGLQLSTMSLILSLYIYLRSMIAIRYVMCKKHSDSTYAKSSAMERDGIKRAAVEMVPI